jgi:hypothetical protein
LAGFQVTRPLRRRRPIRGRYVRIDLPGAARTLGLSEVQVFAPPPGEREALRQLAGAETKPEILSIVKTPAAKRTRAQAARLRRWLDGLSKNLARQGKASQSSTKDKFRAAMAVNGKYVGRHSSTDYSSTATEKDPWWELDLGRDQAIDRIVVWNRMYYYFRGELANFSLTVLDGRRKVVFRREGIGDPLPAVEISNSDERPLAMSSAAATAHQQWGDYRAARSLGPSTHGWSTGLAGRSHAAVYVFKRPVDARKGGLTVHLRHCRGGVWQTAGTEESALPPGRLAGAARLTLAGWLGII